MLNKGFAILSFVFTAAFLLSGCGSDTNNPSSALSVRISTPTFYNLDSDTNEVLQNYQANDSFDDAQIISSPSQTIGFLNVGGMPNGRFINNSDAQDIFYTQLKPHQGIRLEAELSSSSATHTDLDLFLYDNAKNLIKASTTTGNIEEITPPTEGFYYIEVRINPGRQANIHANYLLSIVDNLELSPQNGRNQGVVTLSDAIKIKPQQLTENRLQPEASIAFKQQHPSDKSRWKVERFEPSERFSITPLSTNAKRVKTNNHKIKLLEHIKQKQREGHDAEPIVKYEALTISNDPLSFYQWYLPNIKYPEAYALTESLNLSEVTVAIIDSGIFYHDDLTDNIRDGFDFVRDPSRACDGDGIDADPMEPITGSQDFSFHGTTVAGIIGAKSNNQRGLLGLARNVSIMPIRAIGCDDLGDSYDLEQAIRYAAGLPNSSGIIPNKPADIINLSLGSQDRIDSIGELLAQVEQLGIIVVAAAGNDGTQTNFYPASYDTTFAVTATNYRNQRAPYSNFGSSIDIAAPGGSMTEYNNPTGERDGIISLFVTDSNGQWESSYGFVEGTSIATPIVSAAFALMKGYAPQLDTGFLRQLLIEGLLTGQNTRNDILGYGLIDMESSLFNLISTTQFNAALYSDKTALHINRVKTQAKVKLKATPGDPPVISSILPSHQAIQVSNEATDATGLGEYTVTVDVTALPEKKTHETIEIIASNGQILRLNITIDNRPISNEYNDTGTLYLYVLEKNSNQALISVVMERQGSNYLATIDNLPEGELTIVVANNPDGDATLCETYEFCVITPVKSRVMESRLSIRE
ncbi:MAG: S8 family serine peptidase [Cellvibrionales bacterium]|nr:S8 family serine peptidase [Cellvibrionales bacterium]